MRFFICFHLKSKIKLKLFSKMLVMGKERPQKISTSALLADIYTKGWRTMCIQTAATPPLKELVQTSLSQQHMLILLECSLPCSAVLPMNKRCILFRKMVFSVPGAHIFLLLMNCHKCVSTKASPLHQLPSLMSKLTLSTICRKQDSY